MITSATCSGSHELLLRTYSANLACKRVYRSSPRRRSNRSSLSVFKSQSFLWRGICQTRALSPFSEKNECGPVVWISPPRVAHDFQLRQSKRSGRGHVRLENVAVENLH